MSNSFRFDIGRHHFFPKRCPKLRCPTCYPQEAPKLRVLVRQRLQPPSFGHVYTAKLDPPCVDARITDTALAAKLQDRRADLMLFQNSDNRFVCEPVALHFPSPLNGQSLLENGLL